MLEKGNAECANELKKYIEEENRISEGTKSFDYPEFIEVYSDKEINDQLQAIKVTSKGEFEFQLTENENDLNNILLHSNV